MVKQGQQDTSVLAYYVGIIGARVKVSNAAWTAGSGSSAWLSDGHTWCTVHSRVFWQTGRVPEYVVIADDDSHLYRVSRDLVLEVSKDERGVVRRRHCH